MKRLAAAVLMTLALPAAAQEPLVSAGARVHFILVEGASGVSYRGGLSPDSDWRDIARLADPVWPTLTFPDRLDYRVSSLCADGEALRVVGKPRGEICHVPGDVACRSLETVELALPLKDEAVLRCVREEHYIERETNAWRTRCLAREEYPLPPRLTYRVEVRTRPAQLPDGGGLDLHSQRRLFYKDYTIPRCDELPRGGRPVVPTWSI